MEGADAQLLVRQHLGQAQALNPGKGEVQLLSDALFEQVQVLIPGDGGDDHVQAVDLPRVHLGQGPGQEGGLLLVAALQHHPVPRTDDPLQEGNDALCGGHLAIGVLLYRVHTLQLGSSFVVPHHLLQSPCIIK